ncbi:hypothetical protein FRAHR75_640047 [Frankia sp. Hr75.2]|nr:hypothetical protein FRAHR75_640047 [Frankia sp. Hr75.2]
MWCGPSIGTRPVTSTMTVGGAVATGVLIGRTPRSRLPCVRFLTSANLLKNCRPYSITDPDPRVRTSAPMPPTGCCDTLISATEEFRHAFLPPVELMELDQRPVRIENEEKS